MQPPNFNPEHCLFWSLKCHEMSTQKSKIIDSTSTNLDYQTYLSYFRYVFLHIPTIFDSQPTLCDSSSKSISALFSSKLTGSKETCGTPGGSWRHKGHKVLGNPFPFPWLNKGKLWEIYGKTYGNILCKNVHVLYTANELVCLVSGCPSTHHCRRTPTGSVRRTAAVQTNKCKWTTSKHIEENTKIIQKLSELLSREETKHELSSTLLLFGLTEEHFHGISWLPSAVLLKTIMKPHCPAVSARSSSGLVLQPQLHGSMTLHNHQTVQGCEHPHHPHLRVSGAMKMH